MCVGGGQPALLDLHPLPLCVCRMGGAEGQRVRGGVLGLGLLLGGAVFAHGLALGATKAEILAINDDGERPQREQGREGERERDIWLGEKLSCAHSLPPKEGGSDDATEVPVARREQGRL